MVQLKIKKISMQGFNIAEAGHVAILPPKSISGGSGLINPAFSMKNFEELQTRDYPDRFRSGSHWTGVYLKTGRNCT
jgi:hypothetical protein